MEGVMEECEDDIFYSPERIQEKDGEDGFIYFNSDDEEKTLDGFVYKEVKNMYINNEEEKRKLEEIRAMVAAKDLDLKFVDDLTLLRFLRARDLHLEKALALFMRHLKWRREFVPNGFISPLEVTNQILDGKVCIQGTDKEGCPIGILFGAKHFPSREGMEEFRRFVVYALDKACSRIPEGQSKFTVIIDLEGFAYANADARGYIALLSILQDNYPERLKRAFLIHVPYIFMAVWKLIYPFIDKNTRQKIIFLDNKTMKDSLLREIEESQLPEIYGGHLKLVRIEDV